MKVYKIRHKGTGKFSAGHHRYEVLWDAQGKLWWRLSHVRKHIEFIKKCDGEITSQYRDCEIVTYTMYPESIEDIPL